MCQILNRKTKMVDKKSWNPDEVFQFKVHFTETEMDKIPDTCYNISEKTTEISLNESVFSASIFLCTKQKQKP